MNAVCGLTDIDECTDLRFHYGWSCGRNGIGTCDGFNPPGHFTCTCSDGYTLASNSEVNCIGNTAHTLCSVYDEIAKYQKN